MLPGIPLRFSCIPLHTIINTHLRLFFRLLPAPVIARIDQGARDGVLIQFWSREHVVIYKGIEFTVVTTAEPDIWEWRYQIGHKIKTGRTQTRLSALAVRRVQSKIDAALRAAKSLPSTQIVTERTVVPDELAKI
jgi:hypothetical protein